MNRQQLDSFLAERGFQVDDARHPHASKSNKFADLYVGVGRPPKELWDLGKELLAAEPNLDVEVGTVTNPNHPDHGKPLLEIRSFWDE